MMISSDIEMKEEMKEEMSEGESETESTFDEAELGLHDDVSAQLIAAGPVGLAAAAAIATGRRRKRGYVFETNPAIRRRQQTRLLRRLRATIDEYCVRVGQQAIVICCAPGRSKESFRVFGAKPLEDVLKNIRNVIVQDLEIALAQQAPNAQNEDPTLFELPPLVIDGIPTPVDKMAQQQLRMFIPHMLKYSTGRGKPGWGREELKPVWWPDDVPWKNIRIDERPEEVKQKVSWTHALRQIVKNCYTHHGREDLLPTFDENLEAHVAADDQFCSDRQSHPLSPYPPTIVQTLTNPDGSVSLIQIDPADSPGIPADEIVADGVSALPSNAQILNVSSIQQLGDGNSAVVTLHDGSVHHITDGRTTLPPNSSDAAGSQRFLDAEVEEEYGIEATIDADGQLIVTGDCAALTNADVGDGVYSMMALPGSRGQVLTLVDGEVMELGHHAPKVEKRGALQVTEEAKDDGDDDRILRIHAPSTSSAHTFQGRRKFPSHALPNTGRSFPTISDPSQELTIEGADRSFTVIPSDKFQLIHGDGDAENSLHSGGFHVIEIAPGVQQLELVNNNNNNNNIGGGGGSETIIDAHRALDGPSAGDDPGGGGGVGFGPRCGVSVVNSLTAGERKKR